MQFIYICDYIKPKHGKKEQIVLYEIHKNR